MVVINLTPWQLLIWLAILVVPMLLVLGVQHIRKHRRTDPICQRSMFYRWIGNRLGYWWCSRNRGRSCPTCQAERRKASTGLWTCSARDVGAILCGWTNTGTDATCQRCGARAVDGYGFSI